jgi:hypothetical protein
MKILLLSDMYRHIVTYSRVPNKQTGLIFENEKNTTYVNLFITTYPFINFQQKVPPIHLFQPIH